MLRKLFAQLHPRRITRVEAIFEWFLMTSLFLPTKIALDCRVQRLHMLDQYKTTATRMDAAVVQTRFYDGLG